VAVAVAVKVSVTVRVADWDEVGVAVAVTVNVGVTVRVAVAVYGVLQSTSPALIVKPGPPKGAKLPGIGPYGTPAETNVCPPN
jgi:hypothetical protein